MSVARAGTVRVGLISDTHGLLREEAVAALQGCDSIVHAGDVGKLCVLEALREIAPVTAVRGNVDLKHAWAGSLPEHATVTFRKVRVHVLHRLGDLQLDPDRRGIDCVVSGHSHRPVIERRGKVLYVNPGSAGPRRFRLPVTLALLEIGDRRLDARIVELVET
jgi:putative phosphoesterase